MKTLQQTGMVVPLLVAHNLEVAQEWHPTKNGDLDRNSIPYNSSRRVWWRCSADGRHEWEAMVVNRTMHQYGCPYCSGRKVVPEDSIVGLFPKVASEFHPTKNGNLDPSTLAPQSNKKVWWVCADNHEWMTTVANRTRGSGCHECRRIGNSLAKQSPDIAAQWHPTKNGDATPDQFPNRSEFNAWWQCPNDVSHEWQNIIATRTKGRGKCPNCFPQKRVVPKRKRASSAGSKQSGGIDKGAPDLVPFWDSERNGTLQPKDVTRGSKRVVCWRCPNDASHQWEAPVKTMHTRKYKCSLCDASGFLGAVAESKSIWVLYPELMEEWHPTRNDDLDPKRLGKGSQRKPWWRCKNDPEHEWKAHIFRRTSGSRCPYCFGHKVDSKTCLATVDPEIAATWHPTKNGEMTPQGVSRQSAQSFYWQCDLDPSHVWKQSVQNRVNRRSCPSCGQTKREDYLEEVLLRAISENISYFETFEDSVGSLSKLALIDAGNAALQQVLYRQVFAGIVASMETYLSDAFINTVVPSEDLRHRLMRKTPDFTDKKYSLDEVIDWTQNSKSRVEKYLLDQIFHNLFKVEKLFISVLDVHFPEADHVRYLQRIVNDRHHIVHRNGRTKSGDLLQLSVAEIKKTTSAVREFVDYIDHQLAKKPWL